MQDPEHIVIHYDEIALKSGNRGFFEGLLRRNIQAKLGEDCADCRREAGQITLTLRAGADGAAVRERLACIPGIAYFSPAWRVPPDLPAMKAKAVELLAQRAFTTFKVRTRRHDKQNAFRSMQVNRELGAAVLEAMPGKRVRMDEPDAVLKVEISSKGTYLSVERIEGVGGMPTQARQRVVALLSGGLDSPVAAYLMMKRGCAVTLLHFQNLNEATASVEDKIQRLGLQLARYQLKTRLTIVPFEPLQREIVKHVKATQRMLSYRRVMLRMAARAAAPLCARFLVTGDCLSQVASQTYENLLATYIDAELPILTPLIGMDKREIADIARRIGTFDISALPYDDCCSLFLPKHPELKARAAELREAESRMALAPLIDRSLAEARTVML